MKVGRQAARPRHGNARVAVLGVLMLVGALLPATRARAQQEVESPPPPLEMPERVRLILAGCAEEPLEGAPLLGLLRAEMAHYGVLHVQSVGSLGAGADGAEPRTDPRPTALVTLVPRACWNDGGDRGQIGERVFEVTIVREPNGSSWTGTVDLSDVAAAAVLRSLAAAVAEEVRATWPQLARDQAPPPEPEPEAAAAAEPPATELPPVLAAATAPAEPDAPSRRRAFAISVAFVVRSFASGRIAPLGARLAVDVPTTDLLTLRIAAEAAQGSANDPLGSIELGYLMGSATLAAVASLGADVELTVGTRVGAGVARARGAPNDPATTGGTGFGPLVVLGGTAEIDVLALGPMSLRFGVGASGVLVGYHALVSGVRVAGLTGGVVSGWVGLAVAP